jgi:putative FmdB family regulatory protein
MGLFFQHEVMVMPVYTYRCESCGVQFEQTQKFTDAPLTRCPECGKKSLRKVYQPVGIVFKGSGFYATDHKSPSGGRNKQGTSEGKPAVESSSSSESSGGSEKSSTPPASSTSPATKSD